MLPMQAFPPASPTPMVGPPEGPYPPRAPTVAVAEAAAAAAGRAQLGERMAARGGGNLLLPTSIP